MDKKCVVCGEEIKRKRNKMFCSYKCAGLYRQNYAICPICGKEFKKSPSELTTKTCGDANCRKAYRVKITSPRFMERGHEAIKINPNTGHFDTHHAAVEWRIVSPSGDLYEFKNLVLWAEQNMDLLPVSSRTGKRISAKTFYREIQRLKSDCEKYKSFRGDYYGWTIAKSKPKDC